MALEQVRAPEPWFREPVLYCVSYGDARYFGDFFKNPFIHASTNVSISAYAFQVCRVSMFSSGEKRDNSAN